MTLDVERFAFLLRQRPICTQSPLKSSLGPDLHRELRAKYKLELGLDLLDDRCPNSFNCIASDSGCIGRPLPIDDSILQALNGINVQVTKGIFKGREVYLAQATVTCSGCPFQGQCETSCATQDSFLSRSIKPESNPPESSLVPYEDFERGMYKALTPDDVEHCGVGEWAEYELPLDCLTPKQRQVIEMSLYQGLEQSQIAHILDTTKQDISQTNQLAMKTLHEFGRARKLLKTHPATLRITRYYIHNMSHQEIADLEGKARSTISMSIAKWAKLNGVIVDD